MPIRLVCVLVGSLLLFSPVKALGQGSMGGVVIGPGQQPRDAPPPRTGTGVVKGRVVDGVSGKPVARARVRLMGSGQRPAILTDPSGTFSFTALPVGSFSIGADKSGYMSSNYPEGGRTVRTQSRSMQLQDGQQVTDAVVRLYRGGSIAGKVIDNFGDPVENAQVRLVRLGSTDNGRLAFRQGTSSNDLGEYRIGKLDPGSYVLMVSPQRPGGEMTVTTGTEQEPPTQLLPMYYPTAFSLAQAQPIAVARGQAVPNIDVTLAEGVAAIVTGTVTRVDGQPMAQGGSIQVREASPDVLGGFFSGGTSFRPDGTFRLQLAPGDYVLQANVFDPKPEANNGPQRQQMGMTKLSVGPGATEGVSIVVGASGTLSGRIVFDGSGTARLPQNPTQTFVSLLNSDGAEMCNFNGSRVAEDWTFTMDQVMGTCNVQGNFGIGGWTIKAVLYKGEDILDRKITFEPGQAMKDIEVVMTDRRSMLDFTVTDENGQPTREYVALVFPVDKKRMAASGRYQRVYTPPSQQAIANAMAMRPPSAAGNPLPPAASRQSVQLAPGDYYVIAFDDVEVEASRDPAFLLTLAARATRVSITEGQTAAVTLQRRRLQ